MLENMLIAVNDMMLDSAGIAIAASFVWGIISLLLNPCELASIPLLISYIVGQDPGARKAAFTALAFSMGLVSAVSLIGLTCFIMGRMMGDIPAWSYLAAGLILLHMGFSGFRECCRLRVGRLFKWCLHGYGGGFLLGFLYEMLSGICTFGFLAPILAIVTEERHVFKGVAMMVAFGLGHCIPIIATGSGFGAMSGLTRLSWIRPLSACVIIAIGVYFIICSGVLA